MNRNRKNERGVTIMVVAFTLLAIIGMAALSVDLAELYVARGEAQRAADAGALAGAKMFVTSGFTTLQSSGAPEADPTNICQSGGPGLPQAANVQAEAAVAQNTIAGQPAVVTSVSCDSTTNPENPRITVNVTKTSVPTFFARIWGNTATTVNATAIAEAYNPSGDATHPNTMPIATSVKPWLLPNCDPNATTCASGPYFVDPATGNLLNNASFIGSTISLTLMPSTGGHASGNGGPGLTFYPLNIPTTSPTQAPVCPSCGVSGNSYRENVACASQFLMSCGQPISQSDIVKIQTGFGLSTNTRRGTQCMIHAASDGPNLGQDVVVPPTPPAVMPTIQGGNDNPDSSLIGNNVSRSSSIVTVPLYTENIAGTPLCSGTNCSTSGHTVVSGFLQLAITQTNASGAQLQAVILNASGCSPTSISNFGAVTPVSGSGYSPVPVRLIHN